jgi:hypothetical protein
MTKKIISILAIVAASVTMFAQEAAPVEQSGGLIGKNTVSVAFTDGMLNEVDEDLFATTFQVNEGITSNLDLGFTYAYSWLEGNNNIDFNNVGTYAVVYTTYNQFKPFVKLGLNYNWEDYAGVVKSNYLSWNAFAGVEYSLNSKLGFTFSAGYVDDFNSSNIWRFQSYSLNWRGSIGANYWVTEKIVTGVDVGYREGGNYSVTALVGYKF